MKADKSRLELLNTLDILASHLDTTFTALSTAYARCLPATTTALRPTYLAILIGPSISTARAKVIFGVDGMEEKVWGMRDDGDEEESEEDEAEESEGDDDEDEDGGEDDDDDDDENEDENEDGDEGGPPDSDTDSDEEDDPQSEVNRLPQQLESTKPSQVYAAAHPQSYAELQALLHRADRLFSNTLARAEGEGRGMSSELGGSYSSPS